MAIRYAAVEDGNLRTVDIVLLGDGTSTSVQIDLSQPPFGLNFKANFPTALSVTIPTGNEPSSVAIVGSGILEIQYLRPLPVADLPSLTPRHRIKATLIYG
jgi:hypothetical protein